jgi:hypothetical protein
MNHCFAQKVIKQGDVATIRTGSGSDRPKRQLEKTRFFVQHLAPKMRIWPVATAPGSDVGTFCAKP